MPLHGVPRDHRGGEGRRSRDARPGLTPTDRPHARSGLIGAPIPRVEDARLLTGRGRYVADLAPPGALHVAFVRSPYPHARIVAVDVAPALAAPGVVACVTGAELAPHARPLRAESRNYIKKEPREDRSRGSLSTL